MGHKYFRMRKNARVEELYWHKAETWYISLWKGNHVTNRICPQQLLWHALKTSPNKFCRWSNVDSSHSHVFFWHRGTRIICKNLALSEIFPTQPEIGLILFQGTSPTSWETITNGTRSAVHAVLNDVMGCHTGKMTPPKKSSQNVRITFRFMGLRTPGGKGFRPHFSFGLGFLDTKPPTALLKHQSTTFCVDSKN